MTLMGVVEAKFANMRMYSRGSQPAFQPTVAFNNLTSSLSANWGNINNGLSVCQKGTLTLELMSPVKAPIIWDENEEVDDRSESTKRVKILHVHYRSNPPSGTSKETAVSNMWESQSHTGNDLKARESRATECYWCSAQLRSRFRASNYLKLSFDLEFSLFSSRKRHNSFFKMILEKKKTVFNCN